MLGRVTIKCVQSLCHSRSNHNALKVVGPMRGANIVYLSSRSGNRRKTIVKSSNNKIENVWTKVRDEASGQYYWWNKQTNETTHLGAPDPNITTSLSTPATPPPPAVAQQQQGGVMSGLGGVVLEGMAFGVGSSIARHAVGAIVNQFSGDDSHGGDDEGIDV